VQQHAAVGRSARRRRRIRAIDVDNQGAAADDRQNDLLDRLDRIHISVDQPGRDTEEPARLDLHSLVAVRSKLESGKAADHITEHIAVAVVMPARDREWFRPSAHQRGPLGGKSYLA